MILNDFYISIDAKPVLRVESACCSANIETRPARMHIK